MTSHNNGNNGNNTTNRKLNGKWASQKRLVKPFHRLERADNSQMDETTDNFSLRRIFVSKKIKK